MTYAEFKAEMALLMVVDQTDAEFLAILPRLIQDGELRCYRDCDFPVARRDTSYTLANGSASVVSPADMVVPRRMWVQSLAGVFLGVVSRRDVSYLQEYAPDPAARAMPKYFGSIDETALLLAPVSDGAYSLGLTYTRRPESLSETNPTTWLADFYPDLLKYAAMVVASAYQRNFGAQADSPQMPISWDKLYMTALGEARRESALGKAAGIFDRTVAPPPTSSAP